MVTAFKSDKTFFIKASALYLSSTRLVKNLRSSISFSFIPYIIQLKLGGMVYRLTVFVMRFMSICKCYDHGIKLLEVDLAVVIHVDFANDWLPNVICCGSVLAKDTCDLIRIYGATSILIENTEGSSHICLVHRLSLVDSCSAPLRKVDAATAISVCFVEDFNRALFHNLTVRRSIQLAVCMDKFELRYRTVSTFIELVEALAHLLMLLLRH